MERSHEHQHVLALAHTFVITFFQRWLRERRVLETAWGHLQRTCDLILLSRAFCTPLTLCSCLRMVERAEARAGKGLVTHTHRLRCGGGVADGMERELYPGTVHLGALRSGFLLVARFLKERPLLQLFHGHKSPKYSIKQVIFSHHSNMLYSLSFSYTHRSSAN